MAATHPTPLASGVRWGPFWLDRRLVATATGAPDGLENEMPSIFMQQMDPQELARKYGSFAVLNRPHTMVMLVNNPALMARFVEVASRTILCVWSLRWAVQLLSGDSALGGGWQDYIFIAETDHVLFQDIPNLATETMPAGYKFGYMQPNQGFDRLIKRVWPQVRTPSVWGLSHSRRNATATCLCGRCGVAAPAVACCPSSVCELSAVTSEGRA